MRRLLQIGLGLGMAAAALPCGAQAKGPANDARQAALTLEQQGRNAEAEAAWALVAKAKPASPEAWAHMGLLEARQERYKEAVPLYRKALALGPAIPSLQLNLGLALFKSGELKAALEVFSPLLKSEPGNQQLTTLMGMAHYGLAEYAEAAPYLKEAADRDPQSLTLRLALAHSYLWSKQFQKVMDVYHEILQLDPDSAPANMLAGEALDELRDSEGSTNMFRAAVKANPKEPNAHFGLGYLLWAQKKYPEAAPEFQAELDNDPGHIQALLYLGDSEIQMNHLDAARPLLEKAVQLNPKLGLGHLDLGVIYSENGQTGEALRELTLAEKFTPEDVNVHWRLGRLYRTMGRKEEAKAEFDKASKLNKAADDDLYKKIANGQARPPQTQVPAASPEVK